MNNGKRTLTLSRAEILDGTGFRKGARFFLATPEGMRAMNNHAALMKAAQIAYDWMRGADTRRSSGDVADVLYDAIKAAKREVKS